MSVEPQLIGQNTCISGIVYEWEITFIIWPHIRLKGDCTLKICFGWAKSVKNCPPGGSEHPGKLLCRIETCWVKSKTTFRDVLGHRAGNSPPILLIQSNFARAIPLYTNMWSNSENKLSLACYSVDTGGFRLWHGDPSQILFSAYFRGSKVLHLLEITIPNIPVKREHKYLSPVKRYQGMGGIVLTQHQVHSRNMDSLDVPWYRKGCRSTGIRKLASKRQYRSVWDKGRPNSRGDVAYQVHIGCPSLISASISSGIDFSGCELLREGSCEDRPRNISVMRE